MNNDRARIFFYCPHCKRGYSFFSWLRKHIAKQHGGVI